VQVGIGINTGELVAGYIGSNRTMSYSVIGDTVNTAARLCATAAADQVVVSGSTAEALQDRFALEKLGEVSLKGKKTAVRAFTVSGSVGDISRFTG
jgi:adenylate cyclase